MYRRLYTKIFNTARYPLASSGGIYIVGLSLSWDEYLHYIWGSQLRLEGYVYCVQSHFFQKKFSGQVYWRRKPEYSEKTTDLSQVTDKLYRIMLYLVHLARTGFELTTLVVISTDCIDSHKYNYHTITATTTPVKIISHWVRKLYETLKYIHCDRIEAWQLLIRFSINFYLIINHLYKLTVQVYYML